MANVLDYPITLGFRAIYLPYYGPGGSIAPFHHGEDRGAPVGTDVTVSGVLIGKVGKTGAVTGPHLHTDKRPIGSSVSNRYSFLNPVGWQNITGTVVFTGLLGDAGKVVAIHSGSHEYRFLHLNAINVSVGQQIAPQGETMPNNGIPTDGDIINFKRSQIGVPDYQPTGPEFDFYKAPENGFKRLGYDMRDGMQFQIDRLKAQSGATYKKVGTINGKDVYEKV